MLKRRILVVSMLVVMLCVGFAGGLLMRLSQPNVKSVDQGIVTTRLLPWQANEAANAFIAEKGWTLVTSESHPFKTYWIATRADGSEIKLEVLQERTNDNEVVIFITPVGGDEATAIAHDLASSISTRFGSRNWRL